MARGEIRASAYVMPSVLVIRWLDRAWPFVPLGNISTLGPRGSRECPRDSLDPLDTSLDQLEYKDERIIHGREITERIHWPRFEGALPPFPVGRASNSLAI